MVPRIPSLPYRKVHRILVKAGLIPVGQKGGHVHYRHPNGCKTTVPRHVGDIDGSLVAEILEQAGLNPDDYRR